MAFDIDKLLDSPFLVGLAGSIVALRGAPGKTWLERALSAGSGALLAGFLTEATAEYFGLKTPQMQSAIAFVIGLFGMNLIAALNEWIRITKLADLLPWSKKA